MKKGEKKDYRKSVKKRNYINYKLIYSIIVLILILLFIFLIIFYKTGKIGEVGLPSIGIGKEVGVQGWNCQLNVINPESIIPYPQNILTISCNPVSVDASWRIYANLSEEYDNFSAYYLRDKIFNKTDILLQVDDINGVINPDKRIIIGNPNTNSVVSSIASANGIDINSEVTKGFNQGYVLQTNPNEILILGNSTSGSFYGSISLIWLLSKSGNNIVLPNVKIDDWPDLKVRGFYGTCDAGAIECYYSSGENWIENLTMMKFNMWTHGLGTRLEPNPSQDSINSMLVRERFLKQRHFFTSLALMPYSVVNYNANLREGVFAQNISMRFNSFDQAELIDDSDIIISNSDFETSGSGGVPLFWTQAVNSDYNSWSVDCSEKYSGSCSAKLNITQIGNFEGANLRTLPIYYPLQQNKIYQISIWGKRNGSDLNSPRTQVSFIPVDINNVPIGIDYSVIFDGNNNLWQKYNWALSTYDSRISKFYVYSRAQRPISYTLQLWIDDLNITLLNNKLINVINTSDSQIEVWNEDKTIKYILGVDYSIILGNINVYDPLSGSRTTITRIPTGNIPANSNIFVDYDFIPKIEVSRPERFSLSDSETIKVYNKSILKPTLSVLTPDFVYVGLDEIFGFNRDSRTLEKNLKNYQILGYFVNNMARLIHSYNNSIEILMLDDMVNPMHNGRDEDLQIRYGGQLGKSWYALDLINRTNLSMISWWYGDDTDKKKRISLNLYNEYGFKSFAVPNTLFPSYDTIQWSYEAYINNVEGMIGYEYSEDISSIFFISNYSWNAVKDKSLSQLSLCEDGSTDFDLSSDIFNCGSCDNVCYLPYSYQSCVNGVCHFDSCYEGYDYVDGNCVLNNFCGNNVCQSGEDCSSCPDDCGTCPPPPVDCTKSLWCNGNDVNMNGRVDATDQILVRHQIGRTNCSISSSWCNWTDVNRDGIVNETDELIVRANPTGIGPRCFACSDYCGDCPDCTKSLWCSGADVDRSGKVTLADAARVMSKRGSTDCSETNSWCNNTDLNKDGNVSDADVDIVRANLQITGCFACSDYCGDCHANCTKSLWCNGADLDKDGDVDVRDLLMFSRNNNRTDCSVSNSWCNNTDFNKDGNVSGADREIIIANFGTSGCFACDDYCGDCPETCGNNLCGANETCSTCSADCGTCPCTNCGDGSGGGGGGSSTISNKSSNSTNNMTYNLVNNPDSLFYNQSEDSENPIALSRFSIKEFIKENIIYEIIALILAILIIILFIVRYFKKIN